MDRAHAETALPTARVDLPIGEHAVRLGPDPTAQQGAPRRRLEQRNAARRRIVEDHQLIRDAAQLAMHGRHPGVCITTRRLTTTSNERSGNRAHGHRRRGTFDRGVLLSRALPATPSISFGRVDAGDVRAAARDEQRRAAGAGSDVENRPALDRPDEVGEHPRLRRGDQLADRTAEPAIVEAVGGVRIGVESCSCSDRWPRAVTRRP